MTKKGYLITVSYPTDLLNAWLNAILTGQRNTVLVTGNPEGQIFATTVSTERMSTFKNLTGEIQMKITELP